MGSCLVRMPAGLPGFLPVGMYRLLLDIRLAVAERTVLDVSVSLLAAFSYEWVLIGEKELRGDAEGETRDDDDEDESDGEDGNDGDIDNVELVDGEDEYVIDSSSPTAFLAELLVSIK